MDESEERFRIASQIASDVVYERDIQTGIATFYGDIDSHLGYKPGEYPRTMEGFRQHIHPEDLAWIDRQSIDQLESGATHSIEYRMKKKDGTYMIWWDRVMVIKDEKTGKTIKIIGAANDITERRKTEEAIRENEKKLRLFFESTHDLISLVDAKASTLWANPAWKMVFGSDLTKQENPFKKVHPDDIEKVSKAWESLVSKGKEIKNLEYRFQLEIGYYKYFDTSAHQIVIGEETLYYVVAHDITKHKKVEEQVLAYQKQLRLLASKLSKTEESERRRIATYLHDRIGQALVVTRMKFGALKESDDKKETDRLINEINNLLGHTIEETRSLTFELSPPILYELGFESAIEWIGEKISKSSVETAVKIFAQLPGFICKEVKGNKQKEITTYKVLIMSRMSTHIP